MTLKWRNDIATNSSWCEANSPLAEKLEQLVVQPGLSRLLADLHVQGSKSHYRVHLVDGHSGSIVCHDVERDLDGKIYHLRRGITAILDTWERILVKRPLQQTTKAREQASIQSGRRGIECTTATTCSPEKV